MSSLAGENLDAPNPGGQRARWGMADQGLVSLGNFISTILLPSFLSRRDFGCFVIVFDLILLLNSFTYATICYPLSVRGPGVNLHRFRRYASASVVLTSIWGTALGIVTAVTAGILSHQSQVGIAAGVSLLCWQLQETTRRALMSQSRFADVMWGDAIAYPGQVILLLGIGLTHRGTLANCFWAIGISSLAGFAIQCAQIGLSVVRPRAIREIGGAFWTAGRWMLLSNFASIPTVQGVSWVLGYFNGLAVVGEYGAIVALLRVTNPVISGISGIIVPRAAKANAEHGFATAWRLTLRFAIQGALLLSPVFFVSIFFPGHLLHLVYRHSSFPLDAITGQLRLYAAATLLFFIAQVLLTFMASIDQTRAVFVTQLFTTLATIVISLPLTARFGLWGVVIGVAISTITRLTSASVALWLIRSRQTGSPPIPRLKNQDMELRSVA